MIGSAPCTCFHGRRRRCSLNHQWDKKTTNDDANIAYHTCNDVNMSEEAIVSSIIYSWESNIGTSMLAVAFDVVLCIFVCCATCWWMDPSGILKARPNEEHTLNLNFKNFTAPRYERKIHAGIHLLECNFSLSSLFKQQHSHSSYLKAPS